MTACTGCGAEGQPDGARFCFACGSNLQVSSCDTCHAEIVPGARFCSSCGSVQSAATPASTAAGPVASRRITSVLFGDLVGFTSLSESRDQEDVRELLSRYFEECRQIVTRYGGTVEKFIGDAVMAVWGVPSAHEDDAERAVRAGLELVNAVAAFGSDLGIPDLAMRVGIVTGEVAVTIGAEHQGMVAGDAVNTASRVQSAADPGQVWVDETTRLLTTSAISYVDVGSHQMKGKVDPVPLWSVRAVVAAVGGAQRADGLEAPLVGRDREMRLVKELFHAAEETRRPAALVVDGEPGVGKSRLGWEFEKYVDGLSTSVMWHRGRCLSYGEGVAFFALAEALRGRLQTFHPDLDPTLDGADAQRLALGLDRYVPDPAERAWLQPRLGALLGTGGVGTFPREDLFAAWTTFLRRVGEDQHPVVLVIDDAQHADDGLLLFLEHLLAVGSFPCFVVLLTRPELLEKHPALATNRRATVLHLETLSPIDMGTLLDGLVVGLPDAVRASLVERAEGVPLFAVETVRSLIDRDLVIPRGGQYVLADADGVDLDTVGAPASLQSLIAARLDALPADQRRLVDRASVIGDRFTRANITSLCQDLPDIDGALTGLVRLQLMRVETDRFSNDVGQFRFVQSAVRQVAYGTLSRRDRKVGHLAVVRLLEAEDDQSGELAPIIAQHCLEALDAVSGDGDVEQLTVKAIDQLRRAARRAGSLGASLEAAGHLTAALERATEPAERASIELELARQLLRTTRHDEAVDHAERARDAFDALGDELSAGSAVAVLSHGLGTGGRNIEQAIALAEERLSGLRRRVDAAPVVLELVMAVNTATLRTSSDFGTLCEEQVRLAELVGDPSDIADSYISLSIHYLRGGTRGVSRLLLQAAKDIASINHDPRISSRALINLNADWTQDDADRAAEFGREALTESLAFGHHYWVSAALSNLVLALLVSGDWDEAAGLLDGELRSPLDAPINVTIDRFIAFARGEAPASSPDFDTWQGEGDLGLAAFKSAADALLAMERGDPAAARFGLDAVKKVHGLSSVFDDFTVVWLVASEVALRCGDEATLDELVALVDNHGGSNAPNGLRALRKRVAALVSIRDGAEPLETEALLRASLAAAEPWHSDVAVARASADLGVWLTRQGRADEAAPALARAHEVFERLGAVRWTRELDAELAGVRA